MLRSTKKSSTHFRITSPLRACPDFSSGGSRDGVFSAKEKDEETSYSYFGARYLASDFSFWLSVDPMADKYPYQSPYSYCGWRPINVIQPNENLSTSTKNDDRDLGSFYFHDYQKGESHGCHEVETQFFDDLKQFKSEGNNEIFVKIKYPSKNHLTNGGTEKNKSNE